MQVVILCGGKGTRIRGVSEDLPKPMIPIGGRPIVWHIMKSYAQYGFKKFVLCLGYRSWTFKRYFLDYLHAGADFTVRLGAPNEVEIHHSPQDEDWEVTLAETGEESMTGCRVKRIEPYITGDQFLLTYGDGLADIDLGALTEFHKEHGKLGTVSVVRPPGQGRFGEVTLSRSQVVDFREKPPVVNEWINGGFFVFQRQIFDRLRDDPSLIFERDPLINLCRDGELMAYRHRGFWHCMDTVRDHELLTEMWSRGEAPWASWKSPGIRLAA